MYMRTVWAAVENMFHSVPLFNRLSFHTVCLQSHPGIYLSETSSCMSVCGTDLEKPQTLGNTQKWETGCDWYCLDYKYLCQRFMLLLQDSLHCCAWRRCLSQGQNSCQPRTMNVIMTGEEKNNFCSFWAFPDGVKSVFNLEKVYFLVSASLYVFVAECQKTTTVITCWEHLWKISFTKL